MSLKPKQVDFQETWQQIQLIVNEVISVRPITKNNWSDCFTYPYNDVCLYKRWGLLLEDCITCILHLSVVTVYSQKLLDPCAFSKWTLLKDR